MSLPFNSHSETLADGTIIATNYYPGKDIDPRSGWCSISINGEYLRDRFDNERTFKTFASGKKAALKFIKQQA